MTREAQSTRPEPREDRAGHQNDDPLPEKRREDDTAGTEHRFRDWALI
jgi:hypothetical protein